ncbi:MAG: glycoside hydrolase family 95 protein, partial [Clostridia bacterium]|nr:glycoside hydrolase family 95 protein [Clostridia bacterium]
MTNPIIPPSDKDLILWYDAPAPTEGDEIRNFQLTRPTENDGWEKWSLPIGCGWFGANVFGRTDTERVQITENSLVSPLAGKDSERHGGLADFLELYLDFGHTDVSNYRRFLRLNEGTAGVSYVCDGVLYSREYFASYPDRVLAVSLSASAPGKLSFTVRPTIPFEGEDREDTYELALENRITVGGVYGEYKVRFEAQFAVLADEAAEIIPGEGSVRVEGATCAVILGAFGTDYKLRPSVFTEDDPAKKNAGNPHPHEAVSAILDAACATDYFELRSRHLEDYRSMFGRVTLDLGGEIPKVPTDRLLNEYKSGADSLYLEELYFQYGRYLLISSARPGTLPPNLQGTWNRYDSPPWGSGYWHNINVQMNYWPAFPANLAETFPAYADFVEAFLPAARHIADEYIRGLHPERYEGPGKNGWTVGTAAWPYELVPDTRVDPETGEMTISHSGPGMGGFTSIPFWDWYAFTGDRDVLRRFTWPLLREMAVFLEKNLVERDGNYLASPSASPEQMCGDDAPKGAYYHTVGCAFDQQLIWENRRDRLLAAEEMGVGDEDPVVRDARCHLDKLDPV